MNQQKPIEPNQEIIITIESIGRKGDGIAKYEGFAIIVPRTIRGQTYKVKITDVHETYAFGMKMEEEEWQ